MPWKECNAMDERIRFVARLLDGEKMAVVCREFGISRKTGYKNFNRYKDIGVEGLQDRSRRPQRYANQLPFQVERSILQLKREYPNWGAPKIREKLLREYPNIKPPAKSTVHAVLDRHGLSMCRDVLFDDTRTLYGDLPKRPFMRQTGDVFDETHRVLDHLEDILDRIKS